MQIDKETLLKIAHLARLEFDEKSENAMIESMNEILTWVQKLDELDTNDVEPLTTMSGELNVFREDEPGHGQHLSHERALLNAPKKDASYFRVPKVME